MNIYSVFLLRSYQGYISHLLLNTPAFFFFSSSPQPNLHPTGFLLPSHTVDLTHLPVLRKQWKDQLCSVIFLKKISDWIHSKLERKSYQSRPHEVLSHWTVKLYSKKRLWCPCAMVSSIWRRNPISQRSGAIEKRFRKGFTWRSWVWILIMAQPSVAGCQESNIGDRRDGNTSSPVNHSDTKQS